jgi:hypothetical protein
MELLHLLGTTSTPTTRLKLLTTGMVVDDIETIAFSYSRFC